MSELIEIATRMRPGRAPLEGKVYLIAGRPMAVMQDWLWRWSDGIKEWVADRSMAGIAIIGKRLTPHEAALYGIIDNAGEKEPS